ncbi:MAG: sugar phosphate nucleotidyltransferase, partial [Elusimicrobiota bacterium]
MNWPMAILCGGLGARLGPLTQATPKCLIEVAGKPFLIHQIELLRRHQLTRLVLCAGHMGEAIQRAVGDGRSLKVSIDYVFDGPTLLGTAGALKKALPKLGEIFFVLYGDTYLDIDYQAPLAAMRQSGKQGLMTVFLNAGQWDQSNVLFDQGRIIRYDKRNPSPDMKHIDYG